MLLLVVLVLVVLVLVFMELVGALTGCACETRLSGRKFSCDMVSAVKRGNECFM